jgi:SAM-dependent methyltransferase
MPQTERISVDNETIFRSFANHIQRYNFTEPYCSGRRVLDAGCGTGYGSAHLAMNGAASVVGVDISEEAIAEGNRLYRRDNLRFVKGDVEKLTEVSDLGAPFDVAVNLENIEHLVNPSLFLGALKQILTTDGVFIVSTPNGQLTERDPAGRIRNPFHVREFTEDEFREILGQFFGSIELFGQWRTNEMLTRLDFEKRLFENLCELYYSPSARLWRGLRRLVGKTCVPPPDFTGEGTSFSRDFVIKSIADPPFTWPPDVILAVCRE